MSMGQKRACRIQTENVLGPKLPSMNPEDLSLSVLIATYERRELLKRCLEALVTETHTKPDEVVIVVGAPDRSVELARRILADYPSVITKIFEIRNRSLGHSQNFGLPHCTGDIVATLDDDAFVFVDWVAQVKKSHVEHPEAGCVGGRIINCVPDKLIARFESAVGLPFDKLEGSYMRTVAGVSCTYKRKIMEEVGSFDESLPAGMDTDYNWRIIKAGYRVWFEPKIRVRHMNRVKLRPFLKQMTWYGRGYYLTRRKHADLYSGMPRDMRRWQDWVKLPLVVFNIVIDPIIISLRYPGDRFAFGILMLLKGVYWRKGWLIEWIRSLRQRHFPLRLSRFK